jgi:RecJ-like exonuclease
MKKRGEDQLFICDICGRPLRDQRRLLCEDCKANIQKHLGNDKETEDTEQKSI